MLTPQQYIVLRLIQGEGEFPPGTEIMLYDDGVMMAYDDGAIMQYS
jgi:hypothetical protein